MTKRSITVAGAGIFGLWQALTLVRRGHHVRLVEASSKPFAASASRFAGVMLAPDCEAEAAPALVREHGHEALGLWRAQYRDLVVDAGTLVLAAARDRAELARFARMTAGHCALDQAGLAALEPDLGERFADALYFANESHMVTPAVLARLLEDVRSAGGGIELGTSWPGDGRTDDFVVDCRGLAARKALPTLRGVRGECILLRTNEVTLSRPVRLLHRRHPLYVVPWGDGRFLVGATMIESEDAGPMTVRSALELLGTAYALHPAFGEAQILSADAGVRPAFPDNVPRAIVRSGGKTILVNGAYRHGFLLAPVLAKAVADHLHSGAHHHLVVHE